MKFINNLDYQNVDKCIEQLKTFDISSIEQYSVNYKENITVFHVYWYGTITRKQIASINSYLKTQDLKNVPTKNTSQNLVGQSDQTNTLNDYSTVTDFAKFLG